ncbi:TetR/AcrR family transcriptional regulator [Gordonia jinhuaensis]|uniref:TetR family transcriptional regulator n=1 Tax=Gordonia jinhuaensis TaxID=1517702 RepID=A0A916SVS6_9ACTN|nr:TetR family transcriptional regulator [Gordonia jinhuaensis]GGB19447.1 TetR family transcriptional regulator [Gordonia jinhuaensis]
MARRKDQAAARESIVAATLVAIRDRGIASLRISDIASIAGVSTGTVHYYFDSFENLLMEVHRLASARFFSERLTMVGGLTDARDRLSAMIATGLPQTSDDALVTALYRLDAHMGFRGDHSILITALYDKQVSLYMGIIDVGVAQGHFVLTAPSMDIAANLVTLEDGYGLHIISANGSLSYRRAVELITSYARSATGCAELGQRSEREVK